MKHHYPNCDLGDRCNCQEIDDIEQEQITTMNNDTPRTNDIIEQVKGFRTSSALYSLEQFSRLLERELTAVTEQRDGLRSGIDYASDQLHKVTEQRDKAWQKIENQAERITYLEGATNHATGTPLSKAIEQRDRLLEQQEQWRLSSVCRELVEQRDEARSLAERYRNLSCDSQEEADETILPWETTNPNEQ